MTLHMWPYLVIVLPIIFVPKHVKTDTATTNHCARITNTPMTDRLTAEERLKNLENIVRLCTCGYRVLTSSFLPQRRKRRWAMQPIEAERRNWCLLRKWTASRAWGKTLPGIFAALLLFRSPPRRLKSLSWTLLMPVQACHHLLICAPSWFYLLAFVKVPQTSKSSWTFRDFPFQCATMVGSLGIQQCDLNIQYHFPTWSARFRNQQGWDGKDRNAILYI